MGEAPVAENGTLFGAVSFSGDRRSEVSAVFLTFESETAAEEFARARGLQDYAVGPLAFAVSVVAERPRWAATAS
jgi:hypothetical protein